MAYAPSALRWLAEQWEALIPSAVFSGIVGDAAHTDGYHRAANELPRTDYSLQLTGDRPVDGIDMNAADAIDMNMSKSDMILVTTRMYNSWRDQNDPRLNYWREVIGTLDGSNVIYMDCQLASQGTAGDSHLWHMHAGGLRIHANNMDAMRAFLSIIKGETVTQWRNGGTTVVDYSPYGPPPHFVGSRSEGVMIADLWAQEMFAKSPYDGKSPSLRSAQFNQLLQQVQELLNRPAVQSAPVDPTTLKAVLLDPEVLIAIARSVNDDLARRAKE